MGNRFGDRDGGFDSCHPLSLERSGIGRGSYVGWHDPFPGVELLSEAQVRRLLGFSRAGEFRAFAKEQPHFPKVIEVGKTTAGKPRFRYRKAAVLAWLTLLGKE